MGCNASNHPPYCNCGFGGYQGYTPSNNNSELCLQSTYDEYNEYYIYSSNVDCSFATSVKCRYCDEYIYLYKSPHGNWVLFDELGPPWPKHNCVNFNYEENFPVLFADQNSQSPFKKDWYLVKSVKIEENQRWSRSNSVLYYTLDSEQTWVKLQNGNNEILHYDKKSPIFFKFLEGEEVLISGIKTDKNKYSQEFAFVGNIYKGSHRSYLRQRLKIRNETVDDDIYKNLDKILEWAAFCNDSQEKQLYKKRFVKLLRQLDKSYNAELIKKLKSKYSKIFSK